MGLENLSRKGIKRLGPQGALTEELPEVGVGHQGRGAVVELLLLSLSSRPYRSGAGTSYVIIHDCRYNYNADTIVYDCIDCRSKATGDVFMFNLTIVHKLWRTLG